MTVSSILNNMKKVNHTPAFKIITAVNFILITLAFAASQCTAQSTPARTLLALSKGDHILAIIDPGTLKVIAKVPVGSDPHEVVASADGKTAYVSIYGGGSLHEINVIDLVAQKALPTLDTKPLMGPHGLYFQGGKVWFSAEGTKTVGRYDPATGKFDWCMGTGQNRTHMVYVTPDGKRVYTTNVSSATVSILIDTLMQGGFGPPPGGGGNPPPGAPNAGGPPPGFKPQPREDWVQILIPVGKGSEGFDVSPDGRELWTAGADEGIITIIDLAGKKVKASLNAKVNGANRLKFTPDGKRVLVTSLRNGDLFIFDAVTHQLIKTISTGRGAAGILVDDDGSRAFIGCTGDNYVAVVDLKTLTVTGHIAVNGADGLAWAVRP
jgi:YVTN family beta-propeller protein